MDDDKAFDRTVRLYLLVFISVSFLIGLLIFFLPRMGFLYSLWISLGQILGLDSFFKSMILKENFTAYFNLVFFSLINGAVITILFFGIFYWVKSLVITRKIRKSEAEAKAGSHS
jgi:hypothetical protein